jgi:hypothetical protein
MSSAELSEDDLKRIAKMKVSQPQTPFYMRCCSRDSFERLLVVLAYSSSHLLSNSKILLDVSLI